MTHRLLWCILGLCAGFLSLPLPAAEPPLSMPLSHVARTSEGNFTLYQRGPASEQDLGMPIFQPGEVRESTVYRVRDYKDRDLLYLARTRLAVAKSAGEVQQFYLPALGKGAAHEKDAKTGVITLVAGQKDHLRLVTITPQGEGCELLLEHLQQFTVPARIFTPAEQRIIKLLDDVAARYRTARQVSYAMEQRTQYPAVRGQQPPARILSWKVTFTRPSQLTAVVGSAGQTGMVITAKPGKLHIARQLDMSEDRKVEGQLSLDDLPEMQDDVVAQMMFGERLITPVLETLQQRPVPGKPASEQTEIVLTYPQLNETLHLFIDLRTKQILRSETIIDDEDDTATVIRTYSQVKLTPQAAAPVPAPKRRASAAVPRR